MLERIIATAFFILLMASLPVFFDVSAEIPDNEEPLYTEQITYSDYYDKYSKEKRPDREITIKCVNYASAENGKFSEGSYGEHEDIKDNVLIWESSGGKLTYNIEVAETGIYCLEVSYYPIESNTSAIELGLKIDGKLPYDTASRITLNKVWKDKTEITVDSKGNQIRPGQIQYGIWQKTFVKDVDGLFNDPLIFCLEKGSHEITIEGIKANIALEYLKFCQQEELADYEAPPQSELGEVTGFLRRTEGEHAKYKSDSTLYPTYDRSSYTVSPSDPEKICYNTIGEANWKKALQTITWDIEVDEDGWYKLAIKARQKSVRGLCSNRRLYIDGKVPNKSFDQIKFYYDTDWQIVTPQNEDGEDIYLYLTAGSHELMMEVIPGETGDSMRKLDATVLDINNYYRQILMITGPDPDKYTDYYVHQKIPGLLDGFQRLSDELGRIQNEIETLSDSEGSEAVALERMRIVLDMCIEKPLKIPGYMSQIKDNVTAISSWVRNYREQPLEIDYIEVASPDMEFSDNKAEFWKTVQYNTRRFLASFLDDYNILSDETDEEALDVWVNLGREQAQVVKELTESDFTEKTGIHVNVNLVQGTVAEATLAGKGPDIALFLGGEFPVNLAVRGLLVDVSEFDDYEEVKSRFQDEATVPYEFEGRAYGVPISRTFPMMFYRKDILQELGFNSPPETWDELIDMLPSFQRNYLSMGLVLPSTLVSAGTEAGHTFATLMLQNNLNYYNDEQTKSSFDRTEAVKSFEMWTDFYTKYKFEQTYDAFSRFRTGEYPIVIQPYTFFNQLSVASPEIKGLWDFTEVPGTLQEDGTVSHATNSTGTGAVIFNKVSDKQNAWEFVKWFTSTEVQVKYATEIEALMGTMGRFDTANTEALNQISWSETEKEKLNAQMEELKEIPVILSSYVVTRNIMNAFRETVNNSENPRDTLMNYNRDINEEIARKRENLGMDN